MKTRNPLSLLCVQLLLLFPVMLAAFLLTGCSSERRDRLWQTIDPAGYKHAHSESFNGANALRAPQPKGLPESDEMALELKQ